MIRVSFDFNETTKSVTNVNVIDLENGRTRGIIANTTPIDDSIKQPDLEVLENKLQLSKLAISKLGARADDRISIQYVNEGIGKAVPIIGKAELFTDRLDGNRLAQKGTVAFRGEKRSTLLEFGNMFSFEPYKDGVFKLIPFKSENDSNDLSVEIEDADALNNSEIETEIQDIITSVNDDLPF